MQPPKSCFPAQEPSHTRTLSRKDKACYNVLQGSKTMLFFYCGEELFSIMVDWLQISLLFLPGKASFYGSPPLLITAASADLKSITVFSDYIHGYFYTIHAAIYPEICISRCLTDIQLYHIQQTHGLLLFS